MQFDNTQVYLLVMAGATFVSLVALLLNAWQKSKSTRKKLEDEIERRKEVERDLIRTREMSKTGNWVLELSDKSMQCSDEVSRLLDCWPKSKNVTFQKFLKSVHPDDRSFVKKEIKKALNRGAAFNLTHRIVRRDGSVKTIKQRSEVYLDSKGKPSQIVGTLQDVTDQKAAENLAARLGRILDRSFNEVYTFDAETFEFIKVNLAARLNLCYSKEELSKMTPKDILPEFAWNQVKKLIASLRRGVESVTAFEAVHERKNGTTYPVDIRLQLSRVESRPQFVAIVQDITDRKKVKNFFNKVYHDLEKQVQERTSSLTKSNRDLQIEIDEQKKALEVLETSERRLIEIMNNVVDGIITIDEEGTIHSFNRGAEHLFGFKTEEVLGQNVDILAADADGVQRDNYLKELLQSKISAALGLRRVVSVRKKDGTVFSAELAVNETVIGNQCMFTGLIRDLTEKMETEQELIQILKPLTTS